MKVYGFIGKSGTGKSHRAAWVASENGLDYIIDDGLLIKGNQIIAGSSAKRENTKIGSVKHALFIDEDYKEYMKEEIKNNSVKSILVLGTSEQMVEKIVGNLELGKIDNRIYIEDVATDYEIKQALYTRITEGKHVIPVPTLELKKDFSGYFLDPLQVFRRQAKGNYKAIGEKSVVRPTFTYLGKYTISDYAIYQLCQIAIQTIEGIDKIVRFRADKDNDMINLEIDLVLVYGVNVKNILREARDKVTQEIEKITALNLRKAKVSAKSLIFKKN